MSSNVVYPGYVLHWDSLNQSKVSWLNDLKARPHHSGLMTVCSGLQDILAEDVEEFYNHIHEEPCRLSAQVQGVEVEVTSEVIRFSCTNTPKYLEVDQPCHIPPI